MTDDDFMYLRSATFKFMNLIFIIMCLVILREVLCWMVKGHTILDYSIKNNILLKTIDSKLSSLIE